MNATGKLMIWLLAHLAMAGGTSAGSDLSSTNPYGQIAARNAFGLRTPKASPAASASMSVSNAAPGFTLTGIAEFSGQKWALLTSSAFGKSAKRYTLKEGQTQDELEILSVDAVNGNITIRYGGAETVLSLAAPDNSRKDAQLAANPFAGQFSRAEELQQARERSRTNTDGGTAVGEFAAAQSQAHSGVVRSATFTPDGQLVIVSDGSESVRVWDVATGQPLLDSERVHNPAFTPDGKLVISSDGSNPVRIWDSASGQLLPPQRQ